MPNWLLVWLMKVLNIITIKDKDYIIEFLTKPDNRVGEYEEEGVEAKSIRIVRPNAKIDRITMN